MTSRWRLKISSNYPWDEVNITFSHPLGPFSIPLALRLPEWCEAPQVLINSETAQETNNLKGYMHITRQWRQGISLRCACR